MKISLTVAVQRVVLEEYDCTVEVGHPEEALDLVYEHFSCFPNSELDLITRLKVGEQTLSCGVVDIVPTEVREFANDGYDDSDDRA